MSYTLEKYNGLGSRHTCPSCGKSRVFTKYVEQQSGEIIADHVGRCNREVQCGYHYKPKQFFAENSNLQITKPAIDLRKTDINECAQEFAQNNGKRFGEISYIHNEYLKKSLNPAFQEENNFLKYLKTIIPNDWQRCATLYQIGSAQRWKGATTFWYIDKLGLIRSGKVMQYNPSTGKRIKEPFPHITWVHSELLKKKLISDFNFKPCLFGEHQLIKEPHKTIGIVESEKTAIIASAYLPELTWMAVGSISAINALRLSAISKNRIVMYPDLKGFEKWDSKANDLRRLGFRVTVSDLLEKSPFVTERECLSGFDLGDYLPRCSQPISNLSKLIKKNPDIEILVTQFDLTELKISK